MNDILQFDFTDDSVYLLCCGFAVWIGANYATWPATTTQMAQPQRYNLQCGKTCYMTFGRYFNIKIDSVVVEIFGTHAWWESDIWFTLWSRPTDVIPLMWRRGKCIPIEKSIRFSGCLITRQPPTCTVRVFFLSLSSPKWKELFIYTECRNHWRNMDLTFNWIGIFTLVRCADGVMSTSYQMLTLH